MQKESFPIQAHPNNNSLSSKTISVHTLGCRLNFFETDGILSVLKKNGYRIAETHEDPSHIIVNTCTVTNRADVKNRNIIRSAIKKYPGARVWVTGCYAETDRSVLENIPGVAGVVGNSEKSGLAYRILKDSGLDGSEISVSGVSASAKGNEKILDRFSYSDVLPEGHTRAYLKVQDGCNRKCSYCKIPQARGEGVSREYRDILDQVRFLQDSGIGEIILTGVNLGWYRDSNGTKAFLKLLEDVLNQLDYSRLRLSSIEPPDVGHELADLFTHPRFCNFLHIPLQSGSWKILKSMRRTYNPDSFRKRVEVVRAKNPDIFLGTDVITGFPGEGEDEFRESMDLIQDLGFTRIHAFPYSLRANTQAEKMGDQISKDIKKSRVLELMKVSRENTIQYMEKMQGRNLEAILENDGNLITDNYIKGRLVDEDQRDSLIAGQFLDVELLSVDTDADNPIGIFKIRS